MEERREEDFIVFDNLVQAAPDIAGDSQPVRARKEARVESKYAQENAAGELFLPENLNAVKERAVQAGRHFNSLFPRD